MSILWKNFIMQSLGRNNFRILTINMFDMNMEDEEVESFLRNHVRVISTARYRRDRFGVWNGQRQYQVLLNEDPAGFQGYHHLLASFKIAGVRGYIVYSGQPQYCTLAERIRNEQHIDGVHIPRRFG